MRIKLDYEDRLAFSTIGSPGLGQQQHRTLAIRTGGKNFAVWRTVEPIELAYHAGDESYMREIDRMLVASMERMLTKLFTDAVAAVPEGAELL